MPFDVRCARCGHVLRGLRESKCPACGLAFDWAQAVPIEKLTCGKCGYHLYGLQETRCPECGELFTWQQVLDDYHSRRKPLFEYHWRTRPVRSFFGTWLRALRPGRFWRMVDVHDPVHVRPLLVLFGMSLVGTLCSLIVLGATSNLLLDWTRCLGNPRYRIWCPTWRDVPAYLMQALGRPEVYLMAWPLAIWSGCLLAALMIFRQSMRRCRVRTGHVVRAWVLSGPVWLPVVVTLVMLAVCVHSAMEPWFDDRIYLAVATLSVIVLSTYALARAYGLYVRMPHSAAVAISSQAIAVMATIILEFLTLPAGHVGIAYRVFQVFWGL